MTKRFFRTVFAVLLCFALFTYLFLLVSSYQKERDRVLSSLRDEALWMEEEIQKSGNDFFAGLEEDKFVAYYNMDGSLLYSNGDGTFYEREEVKEALSEGEGKSVKTEENLSLAVTGYALKTSSSHILLLEKQHSSLWLLMLDTLQPILLGLVPGLFVGILLSVRLSKKIVSPLNRAKPGHLKEEAFPEELLPFYRHLSSHMRKTARQLKELEARESEFDTITQYMSEGMVILNGKMEILSSNRSAKKLFGKEGELPKNILQISSSPEFREAIRSSLAGENGYCSLRRNGRFYSILLTPVFNENDVDGAVMIVVDETEKEEREALRREFTSNVSHELKTPLTSISGFAELVRDGIAEGDDAKHFADNICKEASRLIVLVEDILRLSRLEGGEIPYDSEEIDLFALSEEVKDRLASVAKKNGIRLTVKGSSVPVRGNRQILEEMVYNLVDNGIKYNSPGGFCEIRAETSDGFPTLTVRDNGIGIPKEEQSRVFERFYRVNKSHSKEIGGTGLGLSIVKHGAVYHQANIGIEGDLGQGTTFTLRFPPMH